MILYSVNYKGPLTNDEWSIVTIHKTLKGAEEAKAQYIKNCTSTYDDLDCVYEIVEIDTEGYSDIVYDYDKVSIK